MMRSSSSPVKNWSKKKSSWKRLEISYMDEGDSYGNYDATNVGLLIQRLPPDTPLYRLGRGVQLLRRRDVGHRRLDRCRREGSATYIETRCRCVVVELSLVSLPGDFDVHRLRALGRHVGIHVHGACVANDPSARRQSLLAD